MSKTLTNEQILIKAILKAQKNGFFPYWLPKDGIDPNWYYSLPYSHDFAKAFWGETMFNEWDVQYRRMKTEDAKKQGSRKLQDWEFHLQMMVLEEDPLRYLERFLND